MRSRTCLNQMMLGLLLSLASGGAVAATEVAKSAAVAVKDANAQGNTLVPKGVSRYQSTVFPDRIIMLPTATPAVSQRVNWRTKSLVSQVVAGGNNQQPTLVAEIAPATDGPGLHLQAKRY
ncbi:MAG: hypothetical protein KKB45_19150, partial [Gammaproteobacteria bacterium]|nr:hypothetical protein [Gammaproteobacteria bacterium]